MEAKIIKRQSYLNKIIPFIDKQIIKAFTGQRRVGKSYILLQIIDIVKKNNPKSNYIYINKELHKFSHIRNHEDLIKYVEQNTITNKKTYLFIDEIQDIIDFEKALRNFFAEEKYDIYITGSNAKMLSGDLATYLSGRYIEFKINSLSFNEFIEFHKLEPDNKSLLKYIKYGGLPFLKNLQLEDEIVYGYLKNIYNTIILKDIVERYKIRNFFLLENLIGYLSDNFGTILSAKKISDYLKSQKLNFSVKVILQYLSYLQDAFFISKVRRFDIQGKKIFEIGDKFYFEDIGIRNSIIRYKIRDISKILENLIYNHLCFWGYDVFVGVNKTTEIDFIAKKGDEKIYIQVAYQINSEETHKREFGNLIKINDNHKKIVVTMDEFADSNYEGIQHFYILDFLHKFL